MRFSGSRGRLLAGSAKCHARASALKKKRFSQCTPARPAPGSVEVCRPLLPSHLAARPHDLFSVRPLNGLGRTRRARKRLAWRLAETHISHFGHIVAGSPKSSSEMSECVGSWEVSAEEQVTFEMLVKDVLRLCRLEFTESRGTKRPTAHARDCFT